MGKKLDALLASKFKSLISLPAPDSLQPSSFRCYAAPSLLSDPGAKYVGRLCDTGRIIQQPSTKQPNLQSRRNVLKQIAAENDFPLQLEEAIVSSEVFPPANKHESLSDNFYAATCGFGTLNSFDEFSVIASHRSLNILFRFLHWLIFAEYMASTAFSPSGRTRVTPPLHAI
ncbi:hypothetical protein V6N13_055640 [Hibiscus sabdariffa]|uniref:Uncharacterized protein n=2 Tax=Hibiscus sabdariffa TaxID=183260 RepID=A0ABR2NU33_9ROSI